MSKPPVSGIGAQNANEQNEAIQHYYSTFQSKIYDLTRWGFLFGRKGIIQKLPFERDAAFRSLEIGCGTGYNMLELAKYYPNAQLTGLDVSGDMLAIAKKNTAPFKDRTTLLEKPYELGEQAFLGQKDVVIFSYSLTMINPQWQELIRQAYQDLKPGGYVAVADFHNSPFPWFKAHMSNHHVRMDGHLVPLLKELFQPILHQENNAYLGLWKYIMFIGQKRK
ncbi:MAG: class I SAM-dependent methyltransferase [Bacteroidota bacterium]